MGALRLGRSVVVAAQHPVRRRRAVRLLRALRHPRSVMFLCTGNICRSPYAASVARQLVPSDVRVVSAGLLGHGNPPPATAIEVAARRGLDLRDHRSRLLTECDVREADVVLVMERSQAVTVRRRYPTQARKVVVLGDLDSRSSAGRSIRDPHGQPSAVFEVTYSRIDRCVGTLVEVFWR